MILMNIFNEYIKKDLPTTQSSDTAHNFVANIACFEISHYNVCVRVCLWTHVLSLLQCLSFIWHQYLPYAESYSCTTRP